MVLDFPSGQAVDSNQVYNITPKAEPRPDTEQVPGPEPELLPERATDSLHLGEFYYLFWINNSFLLHMHYLCVFISPHTTKKKCRVVLLSERVVPKKHSLVLIPQ